MPDKSKSKETRTRPWEFLKDLRLYFGFCNFSEPDQNPVYKNPIGYDEIKAAKATLKDLKKTLQLITF